MTSVNAPADHLLSWLRGAAIGVVLILGASSPALAAKRIELYDAAGQHSGYAMMQSRAGRVDYYDLRERRTGWGRVKALSDRYRVDLFAADGRPTGYALVDRETGRVEVFDHMSRPLGSGVLDETGRVTTFDLSGRRRSDMALPVSKSRQASWDQPDD